MESEQRQPFIQAWKWALFAILLACLLAIIDLNGGFFTGWLGYLAISFLGTIVIWAVWKWVGGDQSPRWLLYAAGIALLLRVTTSAVLDYALPRYGNPSPASQAGYLYYDAWKRDTDAWDRARSDQPLISAFTERKTSDQYGGLLFSSVFVYRLLGGTIHRPLMVVTWGAVLSAVAVLLSWGFTSMTFGGRAAALAAWVVAIYPEAVFLSSTNMREPFLIAGLGFVLYGYARGRIGEFRASFISIAIGSSLTLLISPPYLFIFLAVIGLAWLWEGRSDRARTGWALILLGILASLALILTVISWVAIPLAPQSNLLKLIDWWVNAGARYELTELEITSGWIQYLFSVVPEWAQIPIATGYGLLQPLLPATIMDNTGVFVARVIMNLRAIGWFAIIPILIYAPFAAVKYRGVRSLHTYIGFLVWVVAVLASYRLADQWDNPRSRAVFLIAQASIVGWAIIQARDVSSRWLWRMYLIEGLFLVVFLIWYGGRYYDLPQVGLLQIIGFFGVFVVLFVSFSLARDFFLERRKRGLPGSSGEV
jgi:hypothetical protein